MATMNAYSCSSMSGSQNNHKLEPRLHKRHYKLSRATITTPMHSICNSISLHYQTST